MVRIHTQKPHERNEEDVGGGGGARVRACHRKNKEPEPPPVRGGRGVGKKIKPTRPKVHGGETIAAITLRRTEKHGGRVVKKKKAGPKKAQRRDKKGTDVENLQRKGAQVMFGEEKRTHRKREGAK